MSWAAERSWRPMLLPGHLFDIQAFVPDGLRSAHRLTVYIEGDGLAWLDRSTPSFAPTPADPVALHLAVADERAPSVYLARPCQFVQGAHFKGCHSPYWGGHRFAPEVIDAMDQALSQLQSTYGASRLVLVGYSGGAAVAALLAARRSDVEGLVTVAGTLDTQLWTELQRVPPLRGSLNPRDVASRLAYLPQWHFVGARDEVVPPSVLTSFLQAVPQARVARTPLVETLPAFDHHCCWAAAWPELRRRFAQPGLPR